MEKAIVHAGYLTIKIVSNIFKSQTLSDSWCVLVQGHNDFPAQINVYTSQTCKKCLKVISLEPQIAWLDASNNQTAGPCFGFSLKGRKYWFVASSEPERQNWVFSLGCVSKSLQEGKRKMDPGDSVNVNNMLYGNVPNFKHTFDVIGDESTDCCHNKLTGPLQLCVDSGCVSFFSNNNFQQSVVWPIKVIRKYGITGDGKSVFFCTGSRSSTGEGTFNFVTSEGESILKLISLEGSRLEKLEAMSQENNDPVSLKSQPVLRKKVSNLDIEKKKSAVFAGKHPSIDGKFADELSSALSPHESHVEKEPLQRSMSASSSKADKKKEKELEKERKKMEKQKEKDMKKEQKRLEKLAKEEARQNKKSSSKKNSTKNTPAPVVEDALYDDPDVYNDIDTPETGAGPATQTVPATKKKPVPAPLKPPEAAHALIYNDPWENKPLIPQSPLSPTHHQDDTDIYAQPEKKPDKPAAAVQIHEPVAYEDVAADISKKAAPPVPPKNFGEDNVGEADSNVYDHFWSTGSEAKPPDHVYGMGSASTPMRVANNYQNTAGSYEVTELIQPRPPEEENPYDDA